MSKTKPDWRAIEIPYRAGILSVRAIARSFGISQPAISKHAKKQGWKRAQFAPQIRQATQEHLAADDKLVNSDNLNTTDNQTDNRESQGERADQIDIDPVTQSVADVYLARAREAGLDEATIIAAASRLQADVITAHRQDMARAIELCKRLVSELSANSLSIEVIEQGLDDLTAGDKTDARYRTLMRAVSHTARSQSMSTLTIALERLVKLERQAFNMDAERGDDTAPTIEERVKKYEADAAIAKSGGRVVRIGSHAPPV